MEAEYFLVFASVQDVGDHVFAEGAASLGEQADAVCDFSGFGCYVNCIKMGIAVGAVTAVVLRFLTEILEDVLAQTVGCRAIEGHGSEAVAVFLPDCFAHFLGQVSAIVLIVFDQEKIGPDILAAVEQNAFCRLPVTAGAPCFLVVTFNAFGHVVVDDVGDVGLIYSHAESIGRNHHFAAVKDEVVLVFESLFVR